MMNSDEIAIDAIMTYRVVTEHRTRLAELVGADKWPAVLAEWQRLDAAWPAATSEGEQRLLAADYLDAIAPYPAIWDEVRVQIALLDEYAAAAFHVAALAEQLGDGAGAAALRADALGSERTQTLLDRFILEQGTGRYAYSIKLRNNGLNLVGLLPAAVSLLTTVQAALDPDRSILAIAMAVVTALAGLNAFKERIPIDDASVFLGLVDAAGETKQAALPDIIAATNAARANAPGFILNPLTDDQVIQSLNNLAALHSIAKLEGQLVWRVVEEYGRV